MRNSFPEWLGAHRVDRRLAAGRDTAVYLSTGPERRVLKAASKLQATQALSRLQREADIMATLDHPHIVKVHGYHEDAQHGFIVMDYIAGDTLAERLSGAPLPPGPALNWTLQLLAALAHVHEKRLVHCDIKPANLLIDSAGALHLTDFGLAVEQGARQGGALGTPAYMAPEQLRAGVLDARTDVFAAAAVLYRMLTGVAPFRGTAFQVVQQIIGFPATPPSRLISALGDALDTPLATAMNRLQSSRYCNASDFADALRSATMLSTSHSTM